MGTGISGPRRYLPQVLRQHSNSQVASRSQVIALMSSQADPGFLTPIFYLYFTAPVNIDPVSHKMNQEKDISDSFVPSLASGVVLMFGNSC